MRVRSSVVERLTADQQVLGSNPGVPFIFSRVHLSDPDLLGINIQIGKNKDYIFFINVDVFIFDKTTHLEA